MAYGEKPKDKTKAKSETTKSTPAKKSDLPILTPTHKRPGRNQGTGRG